MKYNDQYFYKKLEIIEIIEQLNEIVSFKEAI